MNNPLDNFYAKQTAENQEVFLAIRNFLKNYHPEIKETMKYGLPYFEYKGKMLCYFWKDKNSREPYVGFAKGKFLNHPMLMQGDRKLVKVFHLNPDKDLPIDSFTEVLEMAIDFYEQA